VVSPLRIVRIGSICLQRSTLRRSIVIPMNPDSFVGIEQGWRIDLADFADRRKERSEAQLTSQPHRSERFFLHPKRASTPVRIAQLPNESFF